MSVLSNRWIHEAHAIGHVVIEPFVAENVRKSSVDVTLGEFFYRADARPSGGVYNPFSKSDVDRYFAGPFQAKSYLNVWRKMMEIGRLPEGWPVPIEATSGEIWPVETQAVRRLLTEQAAERFGYGLQGIPAEHPLIMLLPRERILAHTHEFIGINPPGTTEMRARSSWGRNGISVCLCAGWGDPGFINRWTMEITNLNDEAVPLPVGERIAQIIFHETGPVDGGTYGAETSYTSKYQQSASIGEIVRNWSPEEMLPRSYQDERWLPLPAGSPALA